jgi:hypothetical protein
MKEITITTLEQFNNLPDKFDEMTYIYLNLNLKIF